MTDPRRGRPPARRPATLPLVLADLLRIDPLARAGTAHLAQGSAQISRVVLAENLDRLRRTPPHALVVLVGDAASGGWSLAAAVHLAWERNLAGVIVPRRVAGPSSAALARRLNLSLLVIDEDPVEVAMALAGQVSAPDAARALRQAVTAEQLAEQTGVRGVLKVLGDELAPIPVALVTGGSVLAGRAAALGEGVGRAAAPGEDTAPVPAETPGRLQVRVPVDEHPEAPELLALLPADMGGAAAQVQALLRLARPAVLAAWARTRLEPAGRAAQEAAAFGLLERAGAAPGSAGSTDPAAPDEGAEPDPPAWSVDLGWQLAGSNRAVRFTPRTGPARGAPELAPLLRSAWQRGRLESPLVPEGDGWISWVSVPGAGPDDAGPVQRALAAFRETALTHDLVVGVGRAHPGVRGLLRSVAEARLAARVARHGGTGATTWFEQVGVGAAVAWLPVSEVVEVARLSLPELMAAADRATLVATVLAVLDHGGALAEAAGRLGVHRNTVLARLTRARTLGLAYDDPGQRLAVHMLCHALVPGAGLGASAPGPTGRSAGAGAGAGAGAD